ncbi:MAG: serine/threonine-protein kinase [Xanthomonadales bacterium]|jgi:serine/threonine-protein kinase|nr:serine/threonine-protein kinase [Xanthomonadales bacterium]
MQDLERLKALFDEAVELEGEARAEFVDRTCGDDDGLRQALLELLAADQQQTIRPDFSLGDEVAAEAALDAALEGTELGAYRLLKRIGAGGMGTVFLAERADGAFERRVAVKVVRRGMDTEQVLQRFQAEREILSRLDHPNIAALLDGGVTPDGRPYLVMEYVDGLPITEYCDTRRLSIERRLDLFRAVCQAVHHAHRNLVVHRDLKPSNILVTGDGTVKLLDFGIAKLLDDAEDPQLTRTGMRALTPAYASPEQLNDEPVTTGTDVYALGVILYELLAGRRPFEALRTPEEMRRQVLSGEAPRPSTALTQMPADAEGRAAEKTLETISASRSVPPGRLRQALTGDLDTICLMAIRREPVERYGSAEQLAEDVGRHLAGQPVRARPPSVSYRLGKFVRRHRAGVAATAVFLLALGATVVFYTDQLQKERDRARVEAETAERVVTFMEELFDLADPEESRGEDITVREVMDEGAERLQEELEDEPAVRARLLDVMGGVYLTLKSSEEAEAVLLQAVGDWERVGGDGDAGLVESLNKLGGVQGQLMKQDEAVRTYERALELARVTEGDPSLKVAELLNNLALIESQRGDYPRMEELLREAIAMEEALAEDGELKAGAKLFNLAWVTQYNGRYDDAIELYLRSRELLEAEYGEDHPRVLYPMQALAVLYTEIGDYAAADALMTEVLGKTRTIYGEESVDYGFALSDMGRIRSGQERFDEAEALLVQAIDVLRAAYDGPHPNVASVIETLGMHHYQMENWEAGAEVFREALAMRDIVLESPHPDISNNLGNLGLLLKKAGQLEEAETLYRQALAMDRELYGEEHREVATSLYNIALIREELGDLDTAEEIHQEALAMRRRLFGDVHSHIAFSLSGLGGLAKRRGDLEAAKPYLEQAYEMRLTLQDGDETHPSVVRAREALENLES